MMLVGTNASHIFPFSDRNGARVSLDLKSNVEQRNDDRDRANYLCEITPVLKRHKTVDPLPD
jgi:hypothetical protein